MFGRVRNLIFIVLAAGIGALVGRWVAEARARIDNGDDPLAVDLKDLQVRPQDFIPGVVAAFRVGEPPWSWLHIPSWLAAFGTNFAAAAVGGDLDRLRQMAEDRALGAFGLQPETEIEIEDVTTADTGYAARPNATTPFTAPPAPAAPPTPAVPTETPGPTASPSAPSSHQSVWTSENSAPTNGSSTSPEAETPGFTPRRD